MTTLGEERIRREYEEREYRARRDKRERDRLTVFKQVVTTARCSRCSHSWPYKEGDEDRPCPACQGGSPQFWRTQEYR